MCNPHGDYFGGLTLRHCWQTTDSGASSGVNGDLGWQNGRKLPFIFTKKSSNGVLWTSVQFTVVHPYKRAQILLQVGFYPKLVSLQWECIGLKQIEIVLKYISDSVGVRCPPPSLPGFPAGTRPDNLHIAKQWWEQSVSWSDFNEEKQKN